MIVLVPHAPPTPEAVELGTKIADLIRLMREENSRIRPQDVRVAFRIAEQDLRAEIGGGVAPRVLIVMAVLTAVGVLGMFVAKQQAQGADTPIPWLMISIGVMVAVLGALAIFRK
jgi:hypothetical protein